MKRFYCISGAGSGIGRAAAQVLASQGASLILIGRNLPTLRQTQSMLERPSEHALASADMRDSEALHRALEQLDLPYLSGVIANAGVGGENQYGPSDRWDEIVSTNLTGTYNLVNECLPYLQRAPQAYRQIVVISSILARLGVPRYSAYCASKAGLLGLTRSWAAEFAPQKILVNAICPGWVATEMAIQGIQLMAEHNEISYEEAYREQMSYVPLGKMSEPEEIAELIAFLMRESQTSITGQVFDVNNGAIMPS